MAIAWPGSSSDAQPWTTTHMFVRAVHCKTAHRLPRVTVTDGAPVWHAAGPYCCWRMLMLPLLIAQPVKGQHA